MGDEWKGQRYGKAGERAEKTKGRRRVIKNQSHAGETQTSAENQKVGGTTFPMNTKYQWLKSDELAVDFSLLAFFGGGVQLKMFAPERKKKRDLLSPSLAIFPWRFNS